MLYHCIFSNTLHCEQLIIMCVPDEIDFSKCTLANEPLFFKVVKLDLRDTYAEEHFDVLFRRSQWIDTWSLSDTRFSSHGLDFMFDIHFDVLLVKFATSVNNHTVVTYSLALQFKACHLYLRITHDILFIDPRKAKWHSRVSFLHIFLSCNGV